MDSGGVLESWNDGTARSAILEFVARVTDERHGDYVPAAERVAVFDNDGTLWCEQPAQAQVFFLLDRVEQLAQRDPRLRDQQPFKAFLERDIKTVAKLGKQGILQVFFATHAGMSEEEFDAVARDWLGAARHPQLGRRFPDCAYLPQKELLALLRAHDFRTFIVSGGGLDLIRAFCERTYGIAREQVIGSSVHTKFEVHGDRAILRKTEALNSFDDHEAKVENIGLHIGCSPLLAFGNSDGDLAMMRYTRLGKGLRLALLLHHDDAEREFAYDREFRLSPLNEALDKAGDYGFTVVSMKQDWNRVFS